MTKDEFLSLETGDSVRIDYNGIVADYTVENRSNEVVLIPDDIVAIHIPKSDVDKWQIDSIVKRRGKRAMKPVRKTSTHLEEFVDGVQVSVL